MADVDLYFPDYMKWSDEYYSYSLKFVDSKTDTSVQITYDGEIWANTGDSANVRMPVNITLNISKHSASVTILSPTNGECRFTSEKIDGILDASAVAHALISKIKDVVPETTRLYGGPSKGRV